MLGCAYCICTELLPCLYRHELNTVVVGSRVSQVSLTSTGDSGLASHRSIMSAKSADSKVALLILGCCVGSYRGCVVVISHMSTKSADAKVALLILGLLCW